MCVLIFSTTFSEIFLILRKIQRAIIINAGRYLYGPGSSVGIATDYGLDSPGSNVDPRPHGVLTYTTSESGVAHRLCWLHAACPVESISHGASSGKSRGLPGDTIISDPLVLTIPHITVLRDMASQHQTCTDTTDRRRRHANRQSVWGMRNKTTVVTNPTLKDNLSYTLCYWAPPA